MDFKTQHFKCYLSMPRVNKKDPHWCSATVISKMGRDHGLARSEAWRMSVSGVCRRACCLVACL